MSIMGDPNILSFLINLISGFTQVILIYLFLKLKSYILSKKSLMSISGGLNDRRLLLLIQSLIVILIGSASLYLFFDILSKIGSMILVFITSMVLLFSFLNELNGYWRIGFNHVSSTIAKDTYLRAFCSTNSSFCIIGTNAFSFSEIPEFLEMLKRIKQCRGEIQILLAHPLSHGLTEAARNRQCRDDLYMNQAIYSLGHILDTRNRLGIDINLRVYNAKNVEDLPIFRSMFLDKSICVTSIAVYGRFDHGKSLPQIFARNVNSVDSSARSMYNVIHRYFCKSWESSYILNSKEECEYINYWKNNYSNFEALSK